MITSEFSYANLYRAYLDCRKNKRNTDDALAFEINAEENLHDLWVALNKGSYHPSASDCFVANSPKLREIIAADFKDRIIHHLHLLVSPDDAVSGVGISTAMWSWL